jgi:hypothetical protein
LISALSNPAVNPRQRWTWVVSSKDGDFVAEHQDLDVLGCVRSGEQHQPAQHAGERQILTVGRPQRAIMLAGFGPAAAAGA